MTLPVIESYPRSPLKKKESVSAQEIMKILANEYGLVEWVPRHPPALELVYTILSQHTSDSNSERAFDNLMREFGSLEQVAGAPVEQIEKTIRTGGLAKVKAPRIKNILNLIFQEVGSYDLTFLRDMPLDKAKMWLRKLPGIGPKTAAVILSFSLGLPAMPVDTHIYRVSKRLGLIGPRVTAEQAHDILEPMVSEEDIFAFHVYLIRHGRQVCKAQRPKCSRCVFFMRCPSRHRFHQST